MNVHTSHPAAGRRHVEGRAAPRINVSWRAEVLRAQAAAIPIKVIDVSEGGLGFTADTWFAIDQEVTLRVAIPTPAASARIRHDVVAARVRYQVLRAGQYCIGVEFSRIDAETRSLIRQRVAALVVPSLAMQPVAGSHAAAVQRPATAGS